MKLFTEKAYLSHLLTSLFLFEQRAKDGGKRSRGLADRPVRVDCCRVCGSAVPVHRERNKLNR